MESASRAEGGLQIRIKGLRREGDTVTMTYVLAWVGEPEPRQRFPTDFNLFYCGQTGRLVGLDLCVGDVQPCKDFLAGPSALFGMGRFSVQGLRELVLRRSSRQEGTLEFVPPPDAHSVCCELGSEWPTLLRTKKVPIPR
jgi:hypothetical protein